jgi:hypothetical protein
MSKIDELLKALMTTVDPDHYKPLLEQLQANTGEQYGMYLAHLLQHNPFLKVSVQPNLANSCNPILIWRQQLAQLLMLFVPSKLHMDVERPRRFKSLCSSVKSNPQPTLRRF